MSAVDAHVGKAIFDKCIVNELKNTTRILVTHQLQHLSVVDKIIVFKDGAIVEMGTYEELMQADRYNHFIHFFSTLRYRSNE